MVYIFKQKLGNINLDDINNNYDFQIIFAILYDYYVSLLKNDTDINNILPGIIEFNDNKNDDNNDEEEIVKLGMQLSNFINFAKDEAEESRILTEILDEKNFLAELQEQQQQSQVPLLMRSNSKRKFVPKYDSQDVDTDTESQNYNSDYELEDKNRGSKKPTPQKNNNWFQNIPTIFPSPTKGGTNTRKNKRKQPKKYKSYNRKNKTKNKTNRKSNSKKHTKSKNKRKPNKTQRKHK
jgi:hypothetical protein